MPPPPPSGIDSRSFNFVFANGLSRYYAVARGSGEARTLEFLMNLVICSAIYTAGTCVCVKQVLRVHREKKNGSSNSNYSYFSPEPYFFSPNTKIIAVA